MSEYIYLDNQSTTACDPEVVKAMMPFLIDQFGNSSSSHKMGVEAKEAVEIARHEVSKLISAISKEIYFTSGATESNNLAILGTAMAHVRLGGNRNRIITSSIEHKSVSGPLDYLAGIGWEIIYLPVDSVGHVCLTALEKEANDKTLLISIQAANSEIGTVQQLGPVSAIAQKNNILLHCDASQIIGKLPFDSCAFKLDMVSISAHKFYGPKGIGGLYIREGRESLPVDPILWGGKQESGLRAGTIPVPLVVGFGKAANLARQNLSSDQSKSKDLRDYFEESLIQALKDKIIINGDIQNRLPNNSNITFTGLEAEMMLANLPNIILSTGSACESGSIEPSRILLNVGLSYERAFSTIRFGFGRFNDKQQINIAIDEIIRVYNYLSSLSI